MFCSKDMTNQSMNAQNTDQQFTGQSQELKEIARFFYKQHFHKQRQAEIGKKSSKCSATP